MFYFEGFLSFGWVEVAGFGGTNDFGLPKVMRVGFRIIVGPAKAICGNGSCCESSWKSICSDMGEHLVERFNMCSVLWWY